MSFHFSYLQFHQEYINIKDITAMPRVPHRCMCKRVALASCSVLGGLEPRGKGILVWWVGLRGDDPLLVPAQAFCFLIQCVNELC